MRFETEKYVSGGYSLARDADGVLFIKGALPGEVVDASLEYRKGKVRFFKLDGVVTPSPDRIDPGCPLYGICGGCDFLHVTPQASALLKEESVKENLSRIGKIRYGFPFEKPSYAKREGYRIRVNFHIEKGRLGFLARKGNKFVPIACCPLLDEKINEFLSKCDFYKGKTLPVFSGDDGISIGNEVVTFSGYKVNALSFFQSNKYLFKDLLDFVKENTVGSTVVDLYSGLGTFSRLFEGEKDVIAVERSEHSLKLFKLNAPSARVYSGDVASFSLPNGENAGTVIVDPPRIGLDKNVPKLITSWHPGRIIYVSCDSTTLSRDLPRFEGYKVTKGKLFDFYPGSSHEESAFVLERI